MLVWRGEKRHYSLSSLTCPLGSRERDSYPGVGDQLQALDQSQHVGSQEHPSPSCHPSVWHWSGGSQEPGKQHYLSQAIKLQHQPSHQANRIPTVLSAQKWGSKDAEPGERWATGQATGSPSTLHELGAFFTAALAHLISQVQKLRPREVPYWARAHTSECWSQCQCQATL